MRSRVSERSADVLAGFADISIFNMLLVGGVAFVASVIGGVAGYGTGALMPLVLVPLVGPEPVVPIIAISALINNAGRVAAYRESVDLRRAGIVIAGAMLTTALGAYGYTMLNGFGAAVVIGTMLMLSVPLRRLLRRHDVKLGDGGLFLGAAGFGVVVGGTSGSGVILLSLLLASGLAGAAVIATDAIVTIVIGVIKVAVFGIAGVITPQVIAYALLIGVVTFPGGFIAKAMVARMTVRIHTAILDAVVIAGGAFMIFTAYSLSR
jgi:uncharacterized membrane protein YfcA